MAELEVKKVKGPVFQCRFCESLFLDESLAKYEQSGCEQFLEEILKKADLAIGQKVYTSRTSDFNLYMIKGFKVKKSGQRSLVVKIVVFDEATQREIGEFEEVPHHILTKEKDQS